MKAAVYYENGGPEVFRYEEVPGPSYLPNEVLIRVHSISIEGGDLINREIRPLFKVPNIVGYQCAGEILAVGQNVLDFFPGQRVVAVTPFGSHAEMVTAPASRTFLLPDSLDYAEGSAIPTTFFTAHECLFTFGHLTAGQTVLIHGGSGALGIAAIQLAKQAGATVIITGADNNKLKLLKALGSDYEINYKEAEFDKVVMEITSNKGADLVMDSVGGGKNLSKSARSLKYKGIISFVGVSGRDTTPFDPVALWPGNLSVTGIYAPSSMDHEPERYRRNTHDMIRQVAEKKLQVIIAKIFPLSQAREAHQYILDKKAFGRVLLKPDALIIP